MSDHPVLYTTKHLQQIFHCSRQKSYQLMNLSGFPSFKIDTNWYVDKSALEAWIAKSRNKTVLTGN